MLAPSLEVENFGRNYQIPGEERVRTASDVGALLLVALPDPRVATQMAALELDLSGRACQRMEIAWRSIGLLKRHENEPAPQDDVADVQS